MSLFLVLAFLFFIGSTAGWIIELFYRRFFSNVNPQRKWINPGICTGPYLPLYGCGLCMLFLIASLEKYSIFENALFSKIMLFTVMAVSLTIIEYIAGIISIKISHIRLWDYNNEWGNIQGIICPKFSLYWAILGALYYFLVHPYIIDALIWLSQNLAFSFVIGLFFGFFIIDLSNATQFIVKLKHFADENEVIVKYEALKNHIRQQHEKSKAKYHFFRPFKSEYGISDIIKELKMSFEQRKRK